MHRFDYTFLENGMVPVSTVSVSSAISAFNAISEERRNRNPEVYDEMQAIARVLSVKASNAIEGIITTEARIKEIVNADSRPLTHDEEEIAGYRDALDEIHKSEGKTQLTEDYIKHLHRLIYSHSGYTSKGEYKTDDNFILEIDPNGKRTIRFKPISAAETPDAMEQLMLAYIDARDNPKINKLLLIPCVVLDFLCIHPFSDGNGRISRLLTIILLYKAGYDIAKYVSFEEQINLSKSFYYDALKESSKGWDDNVNSYNEFMLNFLSTLYKCFKELDKRFSSVNGKKISKTKRIEDAVLNSILPVSKAEICERLPDVSPTTVESVLAKMLKAGAIVKIGQSHNTRYANPKYLSN